MKMRIKKGDQVEVITGKEENKGKRGEVIRVLPKEGRVVVQGVNLLTKHQQQVRSEGKTVNPGIVKFEGPLDVSNVMVVCKKCNKPTRVGITRDGGKAIRVCKKCGGLLD
jgi:large subunit ribosomal protein L24